MFSAFQKNFKRNNRPQVRNCRLQAGNYHCEIRNYDQQAGYANCQVQNYYAQAGNENAQGRKYDDQAQNCVIQPEQLKNQQKTNQSGRILISGLFTNKLKITLC